MSNQRLDFLRMMKEWLEQKHTSVDGDPCHDELSLTRREAKASLLEDMIGEIETLIVEAKNPDLFKPNEEE